VTLTPIQAALVELARDDRRPLDPTDPDDAAVLLRSETLVRQGALGGHALRRAFAEATSLADLRGIVRHAGARHKRGQLDLGKRNLYDLTRDELVAAANQLYSIPADPSAELTEDDVLAQFPGSRLALRPGVDPYDDGPEFGRVVSSCCRCDGVVRSKQQTAVYYDRVTTPEWRVITVDSDITKRGAAPLVTSQALADGAPALCSACTVRLQHGLLKWEDGALRHVIYEGDVTPIDVSVNRDHKQSDVEPVADPVELDVAVGPSDNDDTLTFETLMGLL
jgi:hypothetical protein